DEQTRGLFIKIMSDTATMVAKGPVVASLDFWNAAAGALQFLPSEMRLDRGMVGALQVSWSTLVDRWIQPRPIQRSPSQAILSNFFMFFTQYAKENSWLYSLAEVSDQRDDGTTDWMVTLSLRSKFFVGGPARTKKEAKDMAARLALIDLGVI
ncbi:hypothetical protein FRC01_004580, partial [Tulasnella sp. 417]